LPRLSECPIVPEEVQTAFGLKFESIRRPICKLKGDSPAKTPITAGSSVFTKISPPFSTITSGE
jgi:hypothetical protein